MDSDAAKTKVGLRRTMLTKEMVKLEGSEETELQETV